MIVYRNKIEVVAKGEAYTYDVKIHRHRRNTYVMVDGIKLNIEPPNEREDRWIVRRKRDNLSVSFEEDLAIYDNDQDVRQACAALKAWIEYHATTARIEQAGAFVEAINGSD